MEELSKTGGAHIGSMHASWPFASLRSSSRELVVKCLGTYRFTPEQVWKIEPYGFLPIIASGVRIHHNRTDYPQRVIFFHFGTAQGLCDEIQQSGFRPKGPRVHLPSGMAWRWGFIIAFVLLWNLLFFADMDFRLNQASGHRPGAFALVALASSFFASVALYFLPGTRGLALRPGRDFNEIKGSLVLFMVVFGFLSVMLGFEHFGN
jgi:hypothetical protein